MSNQIQIDNYCSFYAKNQRQPSRTSEDALEASLGRWFTSIRYARDGSFTANSKDGFQYLVPLTKDERAQVLIVDPAFFTSPINVLRANEYCVFYEANQRQPTEDQNKRLALWRKSMKNKISQLDVDLLNRILAVDSAFLD